MIFSYSFRHSRRALLFALCLLIMPPSLWASPRTNNELVVAYEAAPVHLNPATISGTLTGVVGVQLFAGLIRLNNDAEPIPYLAKSWDIAKDGRSIRFSLTPGARFHDGTPITSDDVAFSIMAVKKEHPFRSMLETVVQVDTPDALTAIIKLSSPHPALLKVLVPALVPILPRHVYDTGQPLDSHPANNYPVGSGPFMLQEYVRNSHITLVKNPYFFIPGRPYLDKIIFRIFWDQTEIPLALINQKVHLYPFSNSLTEDEEFYESYPYLQVKRSEYLHIAPMLILAWNLERRPFNDIRVRKALTLAVDRNFIADELFQGHVNPLFGPIPPSAPFFIPPIKTVLPNVAIANILLDEAGYKRGKDGKRFSVVCDYAPESFFEFEVLRYLRHDLARKLGVEFIIRASKDKKDWQHRIAQGKYQITMDELFAWHDPLIGIHRSYSSSNMNRGLARSNTSHYSNAEVDALLQKAARTTSVTRRQELYTAFQKKVRNDYAMLWLVNVPYANIQHTGLSIQQGALNLLSPMDTVYWKQSLPPLGR